MSHKAFRFDVQQISSLKHKSLFSRLLKLTSKNFPFFLFSEIKMYSWTPVLRSVCKGHRHRKLMGWDGEMTPSGKCFHCMDPHLI